ncbi:MAG: thiol reductant ABC exporter subunit CydC [Actinomycetales bacterium]|nr:thiol reductant ABC exporter subunit CydC [Actinomycetales bacterium]
MSELRRAVRLLDVDPRRFAVAVALGVGALGSAVALSAVAAWLIARASQMPPVLELSVATVAVRAFGVGRGVLRYLERIASHEVALRGMTALRTTLYSRLAAGRPEAALRVRRGDLLARVGADVDAVGDVVVRGLLPAAVAGVLAVFTSVAMALFLPTAGLVLFACLVLASVVAPLLAARAARATELRAAHARADMTATALGLLDDAGPLAVAGRADAELAALRDADRRIAAAVDAGAGPSALATAAGTLAQGLAVLGALALGIPAVRSGAMTPVELAVIVLTPLAAFEAASALPAAAVQVERSRAAAGRILALLDDAGDDASSTTTTPARPSPSDTPSPVLRAQALDCGWTGRPLAVAGLDLEVRPGRSVAIVGASGAGKTTALLTLAGLLDPRAGHVTVDRNDVASLSRTARVSAVVVTTEDAHVFGTTVLENLRVARGDLDADEARAVLARVGLGAWLEALPDGLDTLLASDGRTVSGGERRRLLLARGLVGPARILLLDEPAEHLDPRLADELVTGLLTDPRGLDGTPRGVVVATHRLAPLAAADEVIVLREGRVAARGTHADLLADPGYREALERELATERAR